MKGTRQSTDPTTLKVVCMGSSQIIPGEGKKKKKHPSTARHKHNLAPWWILGHNSLVNNMIALCCLSALTGVYQVNIADLDMWLFCLPINFQSARLCIVINWLDYLFTSCFLYSCVLSFSCLVRNLVLSFSWSSWIL